MVHNNFGGIKCTKECVDRKKILICLFLFIAAVTNAYGLEFSASSRGSVGSVSISGSYNLDSSTALGVSAVLGEGSAYQERQIDGAGNNSLTETVSGGLYSIKNTIAGSGQISGSSRISA